jgi:hypothetical protein
MGKPSIHAAFLLIPGGGIIFFLTAMFADSQEGLNEYDESIDYKKLLSDSNMKLNIVSEGNLDLLIINGIKLFIKHENYKYTIMVRTKDFYKIKDDLSVISTRFIIKETTKYVYLKNIKKKELKYWINEKTTS